ncbi:LrgB family protein [Sporosarcina siberiensis]|uniref:LrgB family protein n=1 Tax=Sporosarcina siberiensis TaxID=1365606 RepID=A0ABW4SFU3_9BACL
MQIIMISLSFILLTVVIYYVMNVVYFKFKRDYLLPILTSTIVIILILLIFNIPYETYMLGGKYIDSILGPAIVALAIPLYKQREVLKQNLVPIIAGVTVGVVIGMSSGIVFSKAFGFSTEIILTLLPKSITTPVAIQIVSTIGGVTSLTAVFVMIAGFTGAIVGPTLFKIIKVDTAIGQGIGYGAASHVIGTSKAIEYGEEAGSMSSVAMILCAVVGSVMGPLMAWIFLM